jgi:hypothetical protein
MTSDLKTKGNPTIYFNLGRPKLTRNVEFALLFSCLAFYFICEILENFYFLHKTRIFYLKKEVQIEEGG